jgi:arylsulfatase A-like enzyme
MVGAIRALPLALLAAAACGPPVLPPGDPTVSDVVLVSIDTLRADHLSCQGYSRPTTPFLDELAAGGLRFANTWSASPWTLPSHVSLLTGLEVQHHGVVESDARLGDDTGLLPEAMHAAGFATGGFVSTLFVSRRFGFERGFDAFEDFGITTSRENLAKSVPASRVVDAALRWMATAAAGKPVFLFVHLYDAHYPYAPPAPYATLFDRAPRKTDPVYKNYAWYRKHPLDQAEMAHQVAQYDEAIRYADDQIHRLHESFDKAGRKATWVVTADHGEEFGERGAWGHAHTLFPEQLHVPFIASGARVPLPSPSACGQGKGSLARVISQDVGLVDVAPTLAAWTGASLGPTDGIDLTSRIAAECGAGPEHDLALLGPRNLVAETSRFDSNRLSLRAGGWRFDLDLKGGQREIFFDPTDPGETTDLAAREPGRLASMEAVLLDRIGAPWEGVSETLLTSPGFFVLDGWLDGHSARVSAGFRFAVLPLDAPLSSDAGGRWRTTDGQRPRQGDPVRWVGPATGSVTMSAEEVERLRGLGYVE